MHRIDINNLLSVNLELNDLAASKLSKSIKIIFNLYDFDLETLFIPSVKQSDKIVIMFSDGGRFNTFKRDTKYSRWTYSTLMPDYNLLCIEDPMYKLHNKIIAGWYYGTKDSPFLLRITELIRKFASVLNIHNEHIFLSGQSSGGYAALYIANEIEGSKALAQSPQFFIKNWFESALVEDALNIDFSEDDIFKRNNLCHLKYNIKSEFYIYFNLDSKDDINFQLQPFINKTNLKIELKEGWQKYNNFNFLLSKSGYGHIAFFSPHIECFITSSILENRLNKNSFNYSLFQNKLNNDLKQSLEDQKIQTYKFVIKFIIEKLKNLIGYFDYEISNNGLSFQIYIKLNIKTFYYEISVSNKGIDISLNFEELNIFSLNPLIGISSDDELRIFNINDNFSKMFYTLKDIDNLDAAVDLLTKLISHTNDYTESLLIK
jgi:hypothetical protein